MATIYNIMLYGGLALAVIFAVTAIVLFFTLKIPKAIGDVTGSTARKKIEEIREKGYESVQGVGISKKEAIKNHTTKISVRDVQSSESSKRAEKGRANYEKAVADIKNKKKNEDYLKSIHEEATDILHEDMQELARNMYSDEEATDVLMENEDSEEATDVLRADDDSEEATDVLRAGDDGEEATDVLRAEDDGEEETDVLRADDDEAATDVLRADDDEAATDVLRAEDDDATDVLRNDDTEATSVLTGQSDFTGRLSQGENSMLKMVKNVVIVHTDESI
ncbi:uncharacterized protein BN751_00901 [Coprococcus eutactus CAG:665]|jgi:hypothetical protein|nr:uncharacterized protein BN751_00901 [Coprococcus eutactus CAG:665]